MDTEAVPENFSILKAHKTQRKLSEKVIPKDLFSDKISLVAGADVVYIDRWVAAAVSVLDYDTLNCLEVKPQLAE